MATIIESISNYYLKMENYADPRVKNWFFMSTPIPTILLVIVYNVGVLSIGPRIMAKRKPLELKTAIMLYNIGQILLNSFFVFQCFRLLWFSGDPVRFTCMEVDYSDTPLGRARAGSVWLFFMSRLFDLVDTVFFVLRKKQSQVTFLHVYHHTVVALFGWMGTKFVPGGHGVFFGTINSFVHVVMYSYYSLALINPEYKNAWWKKYLTQMQMIQFVAIGLHAVAALFNPNCNYPKSLIMLALPQNIFMFVLFADFYRKTYIKPMDKTKKA
uniref:Elongation of very long chain fatty acids protein n=1 Tax=Cacopsylla melanoneura TaxID=428564 RepID=A0A8D8UW00_9HEMI